MKPADTLLVVSMTATLLFAGCSNSPRNGRAHLHDGIDGYHRTVSGTSVEAQLWFDQGLQYTYGFNHAEAIRSFEQAAALDPDGPMPWWGIAYAHGMNINDPAMTEERWQLADEAAARALERIGRANDVERALILAIDERYSWPPPEEQRTLDEAYANAMQRAWEQFDDDPDVGALYAESLMDLQPWNYWTSDGEPVERIEEILDVLEAVLELNPLHPGANHFYIHAIEASTNPDAAIVCADRLTTLIPGAGHLVHMPSHIYARVGRYADASRSNEQAIAIDRAYFEHSPEQGLYRIYYAHNIHFLAYSSMMEGRFATAMQAARDLEREIPEEFIREFAFIADGVMPTSYHVMIRFGRWREILEEPPPPDFRLFSLAVHHYARAIALSALGRTDEARSEQNHFEDRVALVPDDWWVFNNRVHDVLPIARAMLEGEIAFREGRRDEAFESLRRGVEAEDALVYDEPPGWMLPVRHALGALLMSDGRFSQAEAVYREDLRHNRGNPWGLLGLQQSLEAQGRVVAARRLEPRVAAAWARADVTATSSCFCEPR